MRTNKRILTVSLLLCSFSVFSQVQTVPSFNSELNKTDIESVLKAVADWQISTPLTHDLTDWTNGALFAGMIEWASIAGDNSYYEWLR